MRHSTPPGGAPRLLALAALVLLLLVAAVTSPVSADVVTQSVSDVESHAHDPNSSGRGYVEDNGVIPQCWFTKSVYPDQVSITNLRYQVKSEYVDDPSGLPNYFIYNSADLTNSGSKVATVDYHFFKNGSDGQYCNYDVVIYFDWCAPPVIKVWYCPTNGVWSDGQSPGSYFRWLINDNKCWALDDYDPYMSMQVKTGGGYICYADDISIYYTHTFTNGYNISTSEYGHIINISRDYPLSQTSSRLLISPPHGDFFATSYTSSASMHNVQLGSTVVLQPQMAKFANTTILSAAPSPPPPPEEGDAFVLALSPTTAAVYEAVTATLSVAAGAPDYDCIDWSWDSYDVHDGQQYRKDGGGWCVAQYNSTSGLYDLAPTADNPLVQTISFPAEDETAKISVRVYNLVQSQKLADLSEYVDISGQSGTYWPLWVGVYDGVSGRALLDVNCQITNLNTGNTSTKLIQRNYFGETLQLNAADTYKITISKTGYESRTWERLTSSTTQISAYLPKLADPAHPDQIKIYLTVSEPGGAPIKGATVQISGLAARITNSQGKAEIQATANTSYSYTVSKTGYIGVSGSLTTLSTSFWEVVHLSPEGAVPTTDPGPGPTTDPGPGPTTDLRTIDQKADSALNILFDNVELFAGLAGLILVCNMLTWILPGGGKGGRKK